METETEIPQTSREELDRQVAAYQQRIERRRAEKDARIAQRAAENEALRQQIAKETEENDPTPAGELIAQAMAGFTLRPRPESEIREYRLRNEIYPRLRNAGFPDRFCQELREWNCKPQATTFSKVEKLFCGAGAIVALIGLRGTGKTTIGAQLALRRIEAWLEWFGKRPEERAGRPPQEPPLYRKLNDLVNRYKPVYGDMGSTKAEDLTTERDRLCREEALVIDELHECDDLRSKDRVLTDILDRRYAAMKDTLIISNQTEEAFRETTNPSVLSRIAEHGLIIPCLWDSWREMEPEQKRTLLGDGGERAASKRTGR